jgi:hypothetical protein
MPFFADSGLKGRRGTRSQPRYQFPGMQPSNGGAASARASLLPTRILGQRILPENLCLPVIPEPGVHSQQGRSSRELRIRYLFSKCNRGAVHECPVLAKFVPSRPVHVSHLAKQAALRSSMQFQTNSSPTTLKNLTSDGLRKHDGEFDCEFVIYYLEEAGRTLLALPSSGYSTKLRSSSMEIVRSAIEGYGWSEKRIRPPVPSAAKITCMDEVLAWLQLIPIDNYVLRRIVGARCLVHPITERHLFTWRRLGTLLGADHKAIKRWHAQGIEIIVAALNRGRNLNTGPASLL